MTFGKQGGGGRRITPRLPVALPASITGLQLSGTAILKDVSSTGAKLSGPCVPHEGHDIWIKVGPVDVLATVVWHQENECGVTFDVPLSSFQLHDLKSRGGHSVFRNITLEQKLAGDDWKSGLAR